MNAVASIIASVIVMFALWQQFDPRVIIVFVVCMGISEVFVKLRWRMAIPCRQCGFDPVLYVKNPELAVEKVKDQLALRKQEAKYLLAKPLNLPTISSDKAKALQTKGKGNLVSRSI